MKIGDRVLYYDHGRPRDLPRWATILKIRRDKDRTIDIEVEDIDGSMFIVERVLVLRSGDELPDDPGLFYAQVP